MRIRFTIDITRHRTEPEPIYDSQLDSTLETADETMIGFRANMPPMDAEEEE